MHSSGEQGMVDEAQKALEEAEALKKVFDSQNLSVDLCFYAFCSFSPFYFT